MSTRKIQKKHIVLFIIWLVFSPLYFWISKKAPKQSFWKRSFWTILSPFGILLLILCFQVKELLNYTNSSSLKQITKAELPMKFVYKTDNLLTFSIRDESTTCYAYFFSTPSNEQYAKLDSLCKIDSSYWTKRIIENKEVYLYSRVWGNGIEAPEGESIDDDRFLDISLSKGSKKILIKYGSW